MKARFGDAGTGTGSCPSITSSYLDFLNKHRTPTGPNSYFGAGIGTGDAILTMLGFLGPDAEASAAGGLAATRDAGAAGGETSAITDQTVTDLAAAKQAAGRVGDPAGTVGTSGSEVPGATSGVRPTVAVRPTGAAGSPAAVAPEAVDPAALQVRAADLQGLRERPWLVRNGTTSAIAARNVATGDVTTFIATEGETMPATWAGLLKDGEQFVPGAGHAEQAILNYLGSDWELIAGGTSRNVCATVCAPLIQGRGGILGGPAFPWNPASGLPKTDYRMFWWNQ